jgi:hypothetical protein
MSGAVPSLKSQVTPRSESRVSTAPAVVVAGPAVAADYALPGWAAESEAPAASRRTGVTDRGITLAEFEDYLRTINNRDGRMV